MRSEQLNSQNPNVQIERSEVIHTHPTCKNPSKTKMMRRHSTGMSTGQISQRTQQNITTLDRLGDPKSDAIMWME